MLLPVSAKITLVPRIVVCQRPRAPDLNVEVKRFRGECKSLRNKRSFSDFCIPSSRQRRSNIDIGGKGAAATQNTGRALFSQTPDSDNAKLQQVRSGGSAFSNNVRRVSLHIVVVSTYYLAACAASSDLDGARGLE